MQLITDKQLEKNMRNAAIVAEYNVLIAEKGARTIITKILADKYNISIKSVYNIVNSDKKINVK